VTAYIFTSESVTEGHPDKVADFISDTILDACLEQNPLARVACETLCKGREVVLAGEISGVALEELDLEDLVRGAIRSVGYTDPRDPFHADGVQITSWLTEQAEEIAQGVAQASDDAAAQGAGDQGIMFGYAYDDTPELMPLPIHLAHRLSRLLSVDRKGRRVGWLRPDGKTQVSVSYEAGRPLQVETVLVSTQHAAAIHQAEIRHYVETDLLPRALGTWYRRGIELLVNPTGSFEHGGPSADAGLTGRKIIVDTYGGMARHGGGAFSGKDPSKVDRSGAYMARLMAKKVVQSGLAKRAEVQVAYAIGRSSPVSVLVETFGTGDGRAAAELVAGFDVSPRAIIEQLDLLRPIYRSTTNYGHFGKAGLPWEGPAMRLSEELPDSKSPPWRKTAWEVYRNATSGLSLLPEE
jgi:S-adenosylmethionine synthetase